MIAALLCLFSLLITGSLEAAEADLCLERGNRLYFLGAYEDAIDMYDAARLGGGAPGVLAYNRGNCLFRLDRFGEALHAYLEAEKHLPRSSNVQNNIAVTASRLGNPPAGGGGFVERLRKSAGWFTASEYGAAGRILLVVFLAAATLSMARARVPSARWVGLVLLPGVVLLGLSAFVDDGPRGSACVVVKNAVLVVNEPTGQGDALFSLREGEVVALEAVRRDWVRIRDREGNRGWARDAAVRPVR